MKILQKVLIRVLIVVGALFLITFGFFGIRDLKATYDLKKTNYDCSLRDPTYREMKDFLARDKTNFNKYRRNVFFGIDWYDCVYFSRDVKKNAIKEGIRCAYVYICKFNKFNEKKPHALVAFNTTDRGVIFIEPQLDKEMKVAVGSKYWSDTITSYRIYWPRINDEK